MIGGLLKSTSSLAIIAAAGMFIGGLALTPAQAADLGGDCCADLEERVADLEATTARKGNRKVSLKITGHVARTIGWYEDDSNTNSTEFYSAGLGPSGSRVQFTGSAKLTSSWTAGYSIRLRFSGDRNGDVLDLAGQSGGADGGFGFGDASSPSVGIDHNYFFLKSAQLGTVIIGHAYGPTSGIANISLAGRGVTGDAGANDWNASSLKGFHLEQDGGRQMIGYVSPTIAGFTLGVSWFDLDIASVAAGGSDDAVDMWDLGLRYAGEFGPIRVAAGIGYTTVDNDELGDGANVLGSATIMHTPTGLNIGISAGTEIDGGLPGTLNLGDDLVTNDAKFWHVSGGINQNFFGPGKTALYGEYGEYEADHDDGGAVSTVTMWGLGLVQNFDSAATELFIAYRNWEDTEDNAGDDDVQQIMAGARIKF